MRKIRMFIICAMVLGAFGATAATAGAYSLGPAGAQVSANGTVGSPPVGRTAGGFVFGPAYVDCSAAHESGTLDGSSGATLSVAFSGCTFGPESGLTGSATVSAPGGMRLSVISSETVEGSTRYYSQLTTGKGGLTVTGGACTLTAAPNQPLVNVSADAKRLVMGSGSNGTTAFLFPRGGVANMDFNPYTGSAGCPAELRGAHSTGFGSNLYQLGLFQGMTVS